MNGNFPCHRGNIMQSVSVEASVDADLDILFGFDRIGDKPKQVVKPPEDILYSLIEKNGFVYWLRAQVLQFKFLKDDGVNFCRESVQNNARGYYPIKLDAFVKSLVEYYLLSNFSMRFDPHRGLDPSLLCSLPLMTERLLAMASVKEIIAGSFKSQALNYLENPAKK